MRRTEADGALLAAIRAIMRVSLHAADEIGSVSVVQLRALTVLADAGECNLVRLAEGVGVTVSTTSRLVDRLIAADLVERRRAPHTGREIVIRLTRRGRKTLDRYDDLRLGVLRGSVEALEDEERDTVLKLLRTISALGRPETCDGEDQRESAAGSGRNP